MVAFADKKPMEYTVPCNCGSSVVVRAGDAGATRTCACGKQLRVPPLSVLRESPCDGVPAPGKSTNGLADLGMFAVTIAIALFSWFQSPSLLIPIGLLTVFAGRIWFAMQILREMAPANALVVLVVPFMPTMFFLQRLDITWKPFIYGIMGIAILIVGAAASQH